MDLSRCLLIPANIHVPKHFLVACLELYLLHSHTSKLITMIRPTIEVVTNCACVVVCAYFGVWVCVCVCVFESQCACLLVCIFVCECPCVCVNVFVYACARLCVCLRHFGFPQAFSQNLQ